MKKRTTKHKLDAPLIVIVGETASGKSGLAMKIARRYRGEIISADSWAIYKGMDIGTAKPSEQEQAEIPHHLIDLIEPDGEYTAAVFKDDALKAIKDVSSRGRLPILVGGTGLYIDGVLYDFSFLKTGDREKRKRYDSMSVEELVKLIVAKGYDLSAVDMRNKRRLIRVLESEGQSPRRGEFRNNTLMIGLRPNRNQLRDNIKRRVEIMFRSGLKKEVIEIADKYGWDCEGLQGIGYKEFKAWHDGQLSMQKVKAKIVYNTLQLAKRQRTWFKRNSHIEWFEDVDKAMKRIGQFLFENNYNS